MKPKNGFSLVELVFALTISSVLLVTIMGLTGRLSQASKEIRTRHAVRPWASVLRSQLENDYRHANSIIVKPKEILIQSTAIPHSLLQRDGEYVSLQVPLLITYRLIEIEGSSVLYRTETRLDRSVADNRIRQLMCQGVERFSVSHPLDTDVPPGILELTVHGTTDTGRPLLNIVMVRHGVLDQ